MRTPTSLTKGVDTFTRLDILRKAAAHKGLKLRADEEKALSEPIKTYALDDELLADLARRGIRQQPRPDCRDAIFTLVDENPQETIPGWMPGNWWNFERREGDGRKYDLRLFLYVELVIDVAKCAVVFRPQAHGPFVSAAARLANFRMFRALVENDDGAPAVAKELAASDEGVVVTWADLGLGGLRRMSDLFAEFAGRNETIKELGTRDRKVFDPVPLREFWGQDDELFIAEPAQPRILQAWRSQLEEYRARLVP